MLEDVTDARALWMADVLVRTINGEYANKLGELVQRACFGLIFVNSHVKYTRFRSETQTSYGDVPQTSLHLW
jgi:hypothetical protein